MLTIALSGPVLPAILQRKASPSPEEALKFGRGFAEGRCVNSLKTGI